jgi:hypothetical protein
MKTLLTLLFLSIALTCFAQTDAEEFYVELNKLRGNGNHLTPDKKIEKSCKKWIDKIGDKLRHNLDDKYSEVLAISTEPLKDWLESPKHKKIILDKKYDFVGFAYVIKNGKPVACARFY